MFDDLFTISAIASAAMTVGGYVFFTSPFVLYILARWRANREPPPDSQLGVKLALGYIASIGMQLALVGGTMLLFAMISKGSERGTVARIAAGLLLPSIAIWLSHTLFLRRTNQDAFPSVRRLLAGYNLMIVSLLGLFAFVMTFQALFAKGSSGEGGRLTVAGLLVYLPAWGFHGYRVFSDRTGVRMRPAPEPAVATLIDTPVVEAPKPVTLEKPKADDASSSRGGLPSLGGGSFPPIDK